MCNIRRQAAVKHAALEKGLKVRDAVEFRITPAQGQHPKRPTREDLRFINAGGSVEGGLLGIRDGTYALGPRRAYLSFLAFSCTWRCNHYKKRTSC